MPGHAARRLAPGALPEVFDGRRLRRDAGVPAHGTCRARAEQAGRRRRGVPSGGPGDRAVAAEELDWLAADSAGDPSRLARLLIRAGKLTSYQAGALAQGKARGLLIGDYLVLDKLGRGGMGVVFKARHRPTDRVVALKILPPSFARDADLVRRFRREFEVAARLSHPNVVSAIDAAEDRGVQFLTMEYIEGHDLDALVDELGPLPLKLALDCTIQAARGLEAAHAQGIIHRDIKPANLILDGSGLVKVLDLGLARVVTASTPFGQTGSAPLTQSGAYMGTVDYMPPEQADDSRKADARADVYALGCTLHFLLTGRPPFEDDSVLKRLMAHQGRPAPSLRDRRPEVPAALESTYQAMMAKRPDERPASMTEIVASLESCRSSPNDAREARATLIDFAGRALKRAAPRPTVRGSKASIFARPKGDGRPSDPELRIEDVLWDFRETEHIDPLTEDQLPPMLPRIAPPRKRGRPPAWAAAVAVAVLGLAAAGWLLTRTPSGRNERPGTVAKGPGTAAPPTDEAGDHFRRGRALFDERKFALAVAPFLETIRLRPSDAEARFYLGCSYHSQRKLDDALAAYEQTLRVRPDYPEVHDRIGRLFAQQGRDDDAVAAYRKAIRIDPRYAEAHRDLGLFLNDRGKLDAAEHELREAIRLEPDDAETHFRLGHVLRGREKRDDAIAAFPRGDTAQARFRLCLQ